MRAQKKDRDALLRFVKMRRPRVQPNRGFWEQLEIWGNCEFEVWEEVEGKKVEKEAYRVWKEGAEEEMQTRVAGYVDK
jgi:hypothetical protein